MAARPEPTGSIFDPWRAKAARRRRWPLPPDQLERKRRYDRERARRPEVRARKAEDARKVPCKLRAHARRVRLEFDRSLTDWQRNKLDILRQIERELARMGLKPYRPRA